MRPTFLLVLVAAICSGQTAQPVSLANADFASSIPVMAMGSGETLYVAYRSFNRMKRSDHLEVAAYDAKTRKEVQRRTIAVPSVHGPRVADGLYLSNDGKMLAYAEPHAPGFVLLISTKDLSEIRRSEHLPFASEDRHRLFSGFDAKDSLAFASNRPGGIRFIRIDTGTLKVVSEANTGGPHQPDVGVGSIVWVPSERVTWIATSPDVWKQYTEDGQATGQELRHRGTTNGVLALGNNEVLTFFGRWADGEVVTYKDHRTEELKLQCSPHLYGTSNDPAYAGAICTTSPDREPERGGDKILSSEFFLLQLSGPSIFWRQEMSFINVAEGHGLDMWFQRGNPLIYRSGDQVRIVAPGKSPALNFYEVALSK